MKKISLDLGSHFPIITRTSRELEQFTDPQGVRHVLVVEAGYAPNYDSVKLNREFITTNDNPLQLLKGTLAINCGQYDYTDKDRVTAQINWRPNGRGEYARINFSSPVTQTDATGTYNTRGELVEISSNGNDKKTSKRLKNKLPSNIGPFNIGNSCRLIEGSNNYRSIINRLLKEDEKNKSPFEPIKLTVNKLPLTIEELKAQSVKHFGGTQIVTSEPQPDNSPPSRLTIDMPIVR